MKKHHFLLVLLLAGIAVFLLNQNRNIKMTETSLREELDMLRAAVKMSPGAAVASIPAGKISSPSVIDQAKMIEEITDILNLVPGPETDKRIGEFEKKYREKLSSASLSECKEICDLLEKNFKFDQKESEIARDIWLSMLGSAAKSDPAWAIARCDKVVSAYKHPAENALKVFNNWFEGDEGAMNPASAEALQKWLDSAQAGNRIQKADPVVSKLRARIAAVLGDSSAAFQQISQLPPSAQESAAIDYIGNLQTTEARRQALEKFSTTLTPRNFSSAVNSMAAEHGFDAAREILDAASLTPEKHDLAAARIAAANIGPETKDRAAWLLENLKSEDAGGLDQFAAAWTSGNYSDAANWITSLPNGQPRDAALKGFVPAAARIDGATAMDWALTVSDPLLRNRLYCEAHAIWSKADAPQADSYRTEKPLDMEAVMAASKPQNAGDDE